MITNRGKLHLIVIKKNKLCPTCGCKKAAIKYGKMVCMECGYLYPKLNQDLGKVEKNESK